MLGMIVHNLLDKCINLRIDIFFREPIAVNQLMYGQRAGLFR